MKTALLLSGGMDSICLAYWKRPDIAITMDYGQLPARAEIRAARAVAQTLGIEHHVLQVDLRPLGSGDMAGTTAIPVSPVPEWWPFRNQMLITLGAMRSVSLGATCLQIGTLASDNRHADGTPAFVEAMDCVLRIQEGNMVLQAPAIQLSAAQLIRTCGIPLEVLAWAHSCHVGDYACGMCRGCQKHFETLKELGFDPY